MKRRSFLQCLAVPAFARRVRGEESAPAWWTRAEPHMGCLWTLTLPGTPAARAESAATDVFAEIARLNAIFSDYESASELNRLCAKAGSPDPVSLSPELFEILKLSRAISEATAGLFDITLGPCTRLWRRSRRRGELPGPEMISDALARTGWDAVILDETSRSARLLKPGMQLDLGGIAKGWTQDACLNLLRTKWGLTCVLLDAAGEVAAGTPPEGRAAWTIALADGKKAGEKTAPLSVGGNVNIATSGDLHQFVEIGGIRYSHIIDPATGLGSTVSRQGTVIASTGAIADPLAKILCLTSPERSLPLLKRHWPEVHARVSQTLRDGTNRTEQSPAFPK